MFIVLGVLSRCCHHIVVRGFTKICPSCISRLSSLTDLSASEHIKELIELDCGGTIKP